VLTKIMKWVSIVALLLAAVSWRAAPNYQFALNMVVFIGAIAVIAQAVRATAYRWASGFAVLALLFNPFLPVFPLSGRLSLFLVLACIAPFAMSLAALKTQPLLSMPSITDRNPRSESL
jgi:hypothetical protein